MDNSLNEKLNIIQIKHDCETIKAILPYMHSNGLISLIFTPYISTFCSNIQDFLHAYGYSFNADNETKYTPKDIRTNLKLFNNRYAKIGKHLLNIDDSQNLEFNNMLKYKFTHSLNIHYNLGIYYSDDKNIIYNTHFHLYLMNDNTLSGNTKNESYKKFGYYLGQIIGELSMMLVDVLPDIKIETNFFNNNFYFQDYNTSKGFNLLESKENGKEITLRLLHILTSINSVKFVLMKIITKQNIWLLKIKYITLYYTVCSIKKILSNDVLVNTVPSDWLLVFRDIEFTTKTLFDSEFRNCMMHYGFVNKEHFVIDKDLLNIELPLFGLIESRFKGKSFDEYVDILDSTIQKTSDALSNIVIINKDNLKKL